MVSLNTTPTSSPSNQETFVVNKMAETTIKVAQEVVFTIFSARTLTPESFVNTMITPRQQALSGLDERTNKFFRKMMIAFDEQLDKVPSLSSGLATLAMFTNDQNVRKKLLEGIALPYVKTLIQDFDAVKTSIVDDIVTN